MIQPPPVLTAAGHTRLILMVHGLAIGGAQTVGPRPSDRLARLRAARETLEAFESIVHLHLRRDLTDVFCYVAQRHPGWTGWAWGHCPPGPTPSRQLRGLWVAGEGGPGEIAAVRAEFVRALEALGCGVEEGSPSRYELPVVRHVAREALTAHRRLEGWMRVRRALAS